MASISDKLIDSLRSSAAYNANVQVAPACILWPDGDRQWEPVVPRLLQELPELCVLGDFEPYQRTGPAIWLRVVVADKAEDTKLPSDKTPILYLPGVRRQDLRAVENCPENLKPLAELQYRGVIWSQVNAKDWTILAYLQSGQGGLGLDVATDNKTKRAMRLALFRLLDERMELLEGSSSPPPMPRPKYRITATGKPVSDYSHATQYLSRRVRNHDIVYDDDVTGDPEKAYRQATDSLNKKSNKERAEALNAWCDKYLLPAEWEKLKVAIRKRRERFERYNDLTTVTISTKAHELLVKVSKRDEVTFSEALEHYLAKAWRSAERGRAKRRPR